MTIFEIGYIFIFILNWYYPKYQQSGCSDKFIDTWYLTCVRINKNHFQKHGRGSLPHAKRSKNELEIINTENKLKTTTENTANH